MSLEWELAHNRQRIEETSKALALAEWKEKEALGVLMDVLQDDEDFIIQEMNLKK